MPFDHLPPIFFFPPFYLLIMWSMDTFFCYRNPSPQYTVVVHSLSCVWLFCNPMHCSPLGSSIHGILRARILEWVAISSFRGSSRPWGRTCVSYVSCIDRRVPYLGSPFSTVSMYNPFSEFSCTQISAGNKRSAWIGQLEGSRGQLIRVGTECGKSTRNVTILLASEE